MIEIIEDSAHWNNQIGTCRMGDCYHTYDFHLLDKKVGEKPILIHYENKGVSVLLPLLLRPIQGTDYVDATSVYGYAGPMVIGNPEEVNIPEFQQELRKKLDELRVVSVFSRLHPYIPYQMKLLEGFGRIETLGAVVNIDIKLDLDTQWSHISKRFRTYINKARRTYRVRKASGAADLKQFIGLYEGTMKRLGAQPHYFFNHSYYENLFFSKTFETQILMAEDPETGTVVSAAMFIICGKMVQYHLSGTHANYTDLHPVKLLIDEMRLQATAAGKQFFNLGGGLGGSEDSLFEFKSRFSKDFRPFRILKYINNVSVYEELSISRLHPKCEQDFRACKDYFPCYRCSLHIP